MATTSRATSRMGAIPEINELMNTLIASTLRYLAGRLSQVMDRTALIRVEHAHERQRTGRDDFRDTLLILDHDPGQSGAVVP